MDGNEWLHLSHGKYCTLCGAEDHAWSWSMIPWPCLGLGSLMEGGGAHSYLCTVNCAVVSYARQTPADDTHTPRYWGKNLFLVSKISLRASKISLRASKIFTNKIEKITRRCKKSQKSCQTGQSIRIL
jgi:hypothetical protein